MLRARPPLFAAIGGPGLVFHPVIDLAGCDRLVGFLGLLKGAVE